MRNTTRHTVFAMAFFALLSFLPACDNPTDDSGDRSASSGVVITLEFPDGYSVDRQTGEVFSTSSATANSAPAYVTSVTLTISGEGIDPLVMDVSLQTGQVQGLIPSGTYTFTIVVKTTYNDTFTGSTVAELGPGTTKEINISLDVNAPPSFTGSLTVSNTAPAKREQVTLTATATDPDPDDVLTYSWSGGGGVIGGSGPSVGWRATKSGTYRVSVTVTDGHGGRIEASATITVVNHAPVISSVTASNTAPAVSDVITLICTATDLDNDPLAYSWSDGLGWTGAGATTPYTVTVAGAITLTCTVDDGDINGTTTASVGINGANPFPGAPTGVTVIPVQWGNLNVTWNPVAGAISYTVYWSTTPGTGMAGTAITGLTTPAHAHLNVSVGPYYYVVTATDAIGESPPSLEATGMARWTRQPGTVGNDNVCDSKIDAAGNIYVAGSTTGGMDGNVNKGLTDIFISKYDTNGVRQWTVQPGSTADDSCGGVAVDSFGNVYAGGYTTGSFEGQPPIGGAQDIILIKYNSAGIKQWAVQFGSTAGEVFGHIGVDATGNAYVTGQSYGASINGVVNPDPPYGDVWISKYNTTGAHQWTVFQGSPLWDVPYAIAVDSVGNSYVTGRTSSNYAGNANAGGAWPYYDVFVTKFDTNGNPIWARQRGTTSTGEYGVAIAVDTAGNVYVGGLTQVGLDGNAYLGGVYDAFLMKFTSAGAWQWTRQLGTAGDDIIYGIDASFAGSVYVTGLTTGNLDGVVNNGGQDAFISTYTPTGVWGGLTYLHGTAANNVGSEISVDATGNIYLSGNTTGALDGNPFMGGTGDVFITKVLK